MKKTILPIIFFASFTSLNAQQKTFAFTAETKAGYQWTALRVLNTNQTEFKETLLSSNLTKSITILPNASDANRQTSTNSITVTGNGVAATAFDKATNRLYFSEMMGNQLKYIDLSKTEPTVAVLANEAFSTGNKVGENNVITRMAFASNGVGYALTNDGKNFIQFTTGNNATIKNLGALRDSKENTTISLHTQCTSWGGDMIGDVYGNLILITMRNHIFKINVNNLEATYIGSIKNLPAQFTTNGAVATEDGNILVASANNAATMYKVNVGTLEAEPVILKGDLFNVSDMANENLVYQSRGVNNNSVLTTRVENVVKVFPNPITNKQLNLQFTQPLQGNYTVAITDVSGKLVQTTSINLNGEGHRNLRLDKAAGKGLYMIRLVDENGKAVLNQKLVVQN